MKAFEKTFDALDAKASQELLKFYLFTVVVKLSGLSGGGESAGSITFAS